MDSRSMKRARRDVRTLLACAVAVTLALAGALARAQTVDAGSISADPYAAAALEFEICHWPQAYAAFAQLADAGDPRAARVAVLMHAHGPRLFAQSFEAKTARLERWREVAASGLLAAKN